jgi:hypothetical protein
VRFIALYPSEAALFPPPRPPFGNGPDRPRRRPRLGFTARLGTLWQASETTPFLPSLRDYPR